MSELTYEITAEAPLAINERKPGGSQYQEGLEYIPGRLVRGALAAQVLRGCKDPGHEQDHSGCDEPALCRALFGGTLLFRDARPARAIRQGPFLLPATAASCKDNSGFLPKKPDDYDEERCGPYRPRRHGVFDTLIDRACWELLRPAALQYAPRCPVCGGRTKAFGGSYSLSQAVARDRRVTLYHRESLARELLTRVAINRRRGVAEDELLYAINALSQFVPDEDEQDDICQKTRFYKARYVGSVSFPGDDGELLGAVKGALEKTRHLGGGSSRGLGRVEVKAIEQPAGPALAKRLAQFNEKLAARWRLMSRLGGQETGPPHYYFAITLQSDAILSADGWQPDMRLSEALLWHACGATSQAPADLRLLRCYTTPVTRGGWQAAWGLPKDTDLAVQAGAVYLYQVDTPDGWTARLQHLEEQGVGARRAEGFGQVRVCDPFHKEAVEEAK